jgi:CAAX protease family protein
MPTDVQSAFAGEKNVITPGRQEQGVEIAVFLFLVVPSMVLSLFAIRRGSLGFTLAATAIIFRDVGLVGLILFFLRRNGEPLARIGWTSRHLVRELMLGGVLFVPFFLGAGLLERALLRAGMSAPATPRPSFLEEQGPTETILAVLLVTVVAIAEETIFRGYLLLRFQAVLRNTSAALLLSSTIFALGDGYEGSAGLVTVGLMGFAFAVVYLWRGSLVAPTVIHFLQDFLGIVLLPVLRGK